jgi:predicted nucleic acid-binding protein
MYLFDTDTITNILKPSPSQSLLNRLKAISKKDQFISSITFYEIVYGAYKSARKEYHLNNLREILLPAVQLVNFDSKAAYVCGTIRADLELTGTPLALADLQIASIALANDLILITGNIKHFQRIPDLKVENWL